MDQLLLAGGGDVGIEEVGAGEGHQQAHHPYQPCNRWSGDKGCNKRKRGL
jgi:hypothetical protein